MFSVDTVGCPLRVWTLEAGWKARPELLIQPGYKLWIMLRWCGKFWVHLDLKTETPNLKPEHQEKKILASESALITWIHLLGALHQCHQDSETAWRLQRDSYITSVQPLKSHLCSQDSLDEPSDTFWFKESGSKAAGLPWGRTTLQFSRTFQTCRKRIRIRRLTGESVLITVVHGVLEGNLSPFHADFPGSRGYNCILGTHTSFGLMESCGDVILAWIHVWAVQQQSEGSYNMLL